MKSDTPRPDLIGKQEKELYNSSLSVVSVWFVDFPPNTFDDLDFSKNNYEICGNVYTEPTLNAKKAYEQAVIMYKLSPWNFDRS